MIDEIYFPVIEGLIFASEDPINAAEIEKAIVAIDGDSAEVSVDGIEKAIEIINQKYEPSYFPFKIVKIAGGYIFATKPELSKYLVYLNSEVGVLDEGHWSL